MVVRDWKQVKAKVVDYLKGVDLSQGPQEAPLASVS